MCLLAALARIYWFLIAILDLAHVVAASFVFLSIDSGFAFSSAEGDHVNQSEDHDIASLKVIQFHREEALRSGNLRSFGNGHTIRNVQSFDKNSVVVSDITDAVSLHDPDGKTIEDLDDR